MSGLIRAESQNKIPDYVLQTSELDNRTNNASLAGRSLRLLSSLAHTTRKTITLGSLLLLSPVLLDNLNYYAFGINNMGGYSKLNTFGMTYPITFNAMEYYDPVFSHYEYHNLMVTRDAPISRALYFDHQMSLFIQAALVSVGLVAGLHAFEIFANRKADEFDLLIPKKVV